MAVSNPKQIIKNVLTPPSSVGEALVNIGDQLTMGSVSTNINAVQAIASDLNRGDGSATGQLVGGTATDVATAVVLGKAGEAVGKGISKISNSIPTTVYRAFGADARAEGFSWTPKILNRQVILETKQAYPPEVVVVLIIVLNLW